MLSRHPTFDVDLTLSSDPDCTGRNIFRDDRTGRGIGTVANCHRRDQDRIATNSDVIANNGRMLVFAVVVGEDRCRADVGSFTDRGVTYVRQVRHLATRANRGLLHLDKGTDLASLTQFGTWPQEREWTNRRMLVNNGAVAMTAKDVRSGTHLSTNQRCVGTDDGSATHGATRVDC